MEFKSIDSLSITECCELLNIDISSLPDSLSERVPCNERESLMLQHLNKLLDADRKAFLACTSIDDYKLYLSTWPDGLWTSKAVKMIQKLRAELKAQKKLIEEQEQERKAKKEVAEELKFFLDNKGSSSGCKLYLEKYPNGKYSAKAHEIIANNNTIELVLGILFWAVVAIGIIAFIISIQ